MYSAVPPLGHSKEPPSTSDVSEPSEEEKSKPAHVQDHQWKRFCELKSRKEQEFAAGTGKRIAAARSKALKNVSQQLSEMDREVMEEQGVSLPRVRGKRTRTRGKEVGREGEEKREEDGGEGKEGSGGKEGQESEWRKVRKLMDPNPQLKGVELGRYASKSKLEEELDDCIERGEFQHAVEMSEKLSQREFASKVTTAFDCRDYIRRKKVEEERKKKKKPAKLKWRFEHKQPWEMKGNM